MSDQENTALFTLINSMNGDIKHIKENMVTYREYNHLHQEYHKTEARVDLIDKSLSERKWTHDIGSKVLLLVIGGVVAAALRLIGVY